MKLRAAQEQDIDAITTILTDNSVEVDKELYLKQIKHNKHFYVLDDEDKVLGFLLAFDKKGLSDPKLKNDPKIKHLLKDKSWEFLYIKEIIVKKSEKGKRLEIILLSAFLDDVADKPVYAVVGEKDPLETFLSFLNFQESETFELEGQPCLIFEWEK
jgi:hypothetical protein